MKVNPALQQFLLLVGALKALAYESHEPSLVLDAYLLRSLAIAAMRLPMTICSNCEAPGPHKYFSLVGGGSVCIDCRPSASATPASETLQLMSDLLTGNWESADTSDPKNRREASGLIAAYLQWHLERELRSLPMVSAQRSETPETSKESNTYITCISDGWKWSLAKARGLPRTKGHEAGEKALFDVVEGAIEIGVSELSAYAFSTENWRRSPEEVKFLMGFNRDVIRRRRDQMHEMGVRVRWVGRPQRLWKSVIEELQVAEELTKKNKVLTLNMCVNYGGRAEIADAAVQLAQDVARKKLKPEQINERVFARYLDEPKMSDVDLFLRSSGEQRTSNFLIWQSAYAEMVFMDVLWPDVTRETLWKAIEIYADRERRFGKA